jgi:N-acetylglucosamine kinase-like BadF-type ATPase
MSDDYFLGIDGGQSHTTALIADADGRIIGRGRGGESNHTRAPGGRERLEQAIVSSVGEALQQAGLLARRLKFEEKKRAIRELKLASAHLSMTGEPEDKIAIVRTLLRAKRLKVDHDAPGALSGALPHANEGAVRIIVLAGTGSVAFGEKGKRQARIGGRGYIFSDEGSAFAIARECVALALRCEERGIRREAIRRALLDFFQRDSLEAIIEDFYAGLISRERLAAFTSRIDDLARDGDPDAATMLQSAAVNLAGMAQAAAARLCENQPERQLIRLSYAGGVFRSRILFSEFRKWLNTFLPQAEIIRPRFGPEVGALLLAYRNAGIKITETLLANVAGKN